MTEVRDYSYRDLAEKVSNIAKTVHHSYGDKDYVISIYAHRKLDHYLALMLMNIFTLMKRSSLIVKTPEEADISIQMFRNTGDMSVIMGRNPSIFSSSMINSQHDFDVDYTFPWDSHLEEYGGE